MIWPISEKRIDHYYSWAKPFRTAFATDIQTAQTAVKLLII